MKIKILKSTPFGPVVILWSVFNDLPQITRVIISKPDYSALDQVTHDYPEDQLSSCKEINAVASDIKSFLDGNDVSFSLDMVTLDRCPPFQKAVLLAEHAIPRGTVSTYKLIASYLGKDQAARAVGNALASNPFPLIVPCHRAIRSDGHLGGFYGGIMMKRALLENEGVTIDDNWRVVSPRIHYQK
jgi:methylated-DNA-[protein]-cysteine S-methyltransferase